MHAAALAPSRDVFPCWEKAEVLDRRDDHFASQLKVHEVIK